MREFETILCKRVIRQPIPALNPGGDCGPCCLAGLFGLSIEDIYERIKNEEKAGLSWLGMYYFLHQAVADRLVDFVITDVPSWQRSPSQMLFGNPGWCSNLQWFGYMTMAFQAGYYGLAAVAHDRTGPLSATVGDHWVLLCGARARFEPTQNPHAKVLVTEILVSNSSSQPTAKEGWVDVLEFLRNWGGYNCFLVRPAKD